MSLRFEWQSPPKPISTCKPDTPLSQLPVLSNCSKWFHFQQTHSQKGPGWSYMSERAKHTNSQTGGCCHTLSDLTSVRRAFSLSLDWYTHFGLRTLLGGGFFTGLACFTLDVGGSLSGNWPPPWKKLCNQQWKFTSVIHNQNTWKVKKNAIYYHKTQNMQNQLGSTQWKVNYLKLALQVTSVTVLWKPFSHWTVTYPINKTSMWS